MFGWPDGVLNLVILFSYGRKCLLNATMIFEGKRKSRGVVYVRDVYSCIAWIFLLPAPFSGYSFHCSLRTTCSTGYSIRVL